MLMPHNQEKYVLIFENLKKFFFGLSVVNWVLIYAKPPFKLNFLGRKAKKAPLIT